MTRCSSLSVHLSSRTGFGFEAGTWKRWVAWWFDAKDIYQHSFQDRGKWIQSKLLGGNRLYSESDEENDLQSRMASSRSTIPSTSTDDDYTLSLLLMNALHDGDWGRAKRILDLNPNALTIRTPPFEETALHIVVRTGKVWLVQLLVSLSTLEALELRSTSGATALSIVAVGGIKEIAEILVSRNDNLACMVNSVGLLPIVIAASHGNKDMVQYLYSVTPIRELSPETSVNGATLLNYSIISDIYDIALDLLRHYPKLATTPDLFGNTAICVLSTLPHAFPSGYQKGIWQRLIYACIPVQLSEPTATVYIRTKVEDSHDNGNPQVDQFNSVIHRIRGLVWNALILSGIKQIHDTKLVHAQSLEVLRIFCDQISLINFQHLPETQVYRAMMEASKNGIVEFISELLKFNPYFKFQLDEYRRGIFSIAVQYRQEKIFNLAYEMGEKKDILSTRDMFENSTLHFAAMLAPSAQLDRVSGAALQMQRELQWFKEVESLMQPRYKVLANSQGKTPRALFTEQHKELVKDGEKWLKETSQACMVVATLIATVMFTTAFTVPGGNKSDIGIPIFLHSKAFMVFIVSDALSLFSSCTSVLMFLAILTSRYAEEDFLRSLPKKLIIGLASLFFSIVAMMSAFGATLFILMHEKIKWVVIPVTLTASVPVTLFALLQFPLFVDIVFRTYGSGIFHKPSKH